MLGSGPGRRWLPGPPAWLGPVSPQSASAATARPTAEAGEWPPAAPRASTGWQCGAAPAPRYRQVGPAVGAGAGGGSGGGGGWGWAIWWEQAAGGTGTAAVTALTVRCPPAVAEDHNSCRNPDGDAAPWCYIRGDAGVPERRPCDIIQCSGRSSPRRSPFSCLPGTLLLEASCRWGLALSPGWSLLCAQTTPGCGSITAFLRNGVYPGPPSSPPLCVHICLPAVPCSAPRAFPLVPEKVCAKPCGPPAPPISLAR